MTLASDAITGTETPEPAPRSKTLAWIVTILLIAGLAAGSWFSWNRWFAGPTESGELDIGTISDRFRPRMAMNPRPAPELAKDGVHPIGGNLFQITSGEYYMRLAPVETSYAPVRLFVNRGDVLPADARVLIRMVRDPGLAAAAAGLQMTPDQVKQLIAFRAQLQNGMNIAPADREKLSVDWKSWNGSKDPAAKAAAEKTLLASMKDVGARSLDPTRKQYSDIAAEIHKIVNDQQINRYRQLRGL